MDIPKPEFTPVGEGHYTYSGPVTRPVVIESSWGHEVQYSRDAGFLGLIKLKPGHATGHYLQLNNYITIVCMAGEVGLNMIIEGKTHTHTLHPGEAFKIGAGLAVELVGRSKEESLLAYSGDLSYFEKAVKIS